MTPQDKVREFHKIFGDKEDPRFPTWPDAQLARLRRALLVEECVEAEEEFRAIERDDDKASLALLAKELADILYVTYGAALAFGIDLDSVFDVVHESNLSKLDENHRPIYREDGKVLKGPNYQPADIDAELERQHEGSPV